MGQPCEFQVDEAAAGTPIAAVEMLGLWQRARVLCEALWCCVITASPPRRWVCPHTARPNISTAAARKGCGAGPVHLPALALMRALAAPA